MDVLLMPPLAFLIYLFAAGILMLLGKHIAAGRSSPSTLKQSLYASGNPPPESATPSYGARGYLIALFFAALHLGALIVGSSDLSLSAAIYIAGLALTLIVLLLG